MSNKTTILKTLGMLKAAYPRQQLSNETIDIYELALRDLDQELLKTAILRLISKSVFFPTIAEIRGAVADIQLEVTGLPTPYEAWELAMRGGVECPDIVRQTVHAIGMDFYNLYRSTNGTSDRVRFLEAYNEIVSKMRQELTELIAVKQYIALQAGGDGPGWLDGVDIPRLQEVDDERLD